VNRSFYRRPAPKPRELTKGSPPAHLSFELALRADPQLNITVRVDRLMKSLSERTGYASMSVERMAAELHASPGAVRKARRKLVRKLGHFESPVGWKYRRAKTKGDSRTDRHLDLTGRCAFLFADLTAKTGRIELSYAEIAAHLNTDHPLRAVQGVLALGGYFERTGSAGQRNTYARLWDHYQPETAEHDNGHEHPEPDAADPYARFERRTDRRRERAAADREGV
jgi:hypothetical protein